MKREEIEQHEMIIHGCIAESKLPHKTKKDARESLNILRDLAY